MRQNRLSTYVWTGILLSGLVSVELMAQTSTHFGGADVTSKANDIQQFLFGPAMRFAGVLGGAYGVLQAVLTSAMKPLIVYGGIGMAANIVPKFIDNVFSLMLP